MKLKEKCPTNLKDKVKEHVYDIVHTQMLAWDFSPHFIEHELTVPCLGISVPGRDGHHARHTGLFHRLQDCRHALGELGHGPFELFGESQDRDHNIVALENGRQRDWVKHISL